MNFKKDFKVDFLSKRGSRKLSQNFIPIRYSLPVEYSLPVAYSLYDIGSMITVKFVFSLLIVKNNEFYKTKRVFCSVFPSS